jgi:hypothetical protein
MPSRTQAAVLAAALVVLLTELLVPSPARTSAPTRKKTVEVEMKNVDLHVTPDITLNIRSLRGRFVPVGKHLVPFFDDPTSYVVQVDAGEVAMGEASLNAMLVEEVFGAMDDPPFKELYVRAEGGVLRQKGVLDKKIDLPFSVKGTVSATTDGRIRIHSKSVKSFGIPVKPLMKLFSIEMDDLVKVEAGHGVIVDDNDMIVDPQRMLPPPRMQGRITAVRVENGAIVQTFGPAAFRGLQPPASCPNHFYWYGGDLRFGRLTMTKTDLELVDQDPSDPFDFSVAGYPKMLVAGYSKTQPDGSVRTYLPDHDDLVASRRTVNRPAPVPVRHTATRVSGRSSRP